MELRQEAHRLQLLATPAQTTDIAAMLGKLILHYSTGKDTVGLQHVVGDYIDDLCEYPSSVIDDACRTYRRNPESRFFPKIGELRALCDVEFRPLMKRISLIDRLIREIEGEGMAKLEVEKPKDDDFDSLIKKLKENLT